jgi:GntR family transcriptional regulator, rspAB operon transcriptional repressor
MAMLLRDDIYAALRSEILSCSLPPGSDLREQQLAQKFSVSKSPVREALIRLEREQLVEVASRQGYRVRPVSISDARDMYSFRSVLEAACAMQAAHEADDATLAALDTYRSLPKRIDMEEFVRRNREFHCAVFNASRNKRMAAVARELIEQMDRMTLISIHTIKGRDTGQLVQEHCRIIDALQARNGRTAAKLLRAHVEAAAKRMLKGLGSSAVTA